MTPPNTKPLVQMENVHKSFGTVEVLKGASLSVNEGEAVCIIGPSGSGKSTLLRCINALVPINSGSIRVGDFQVDRLSREKDLIALRQQVSMVFQQYNLFPHKNVLDNVSMAPIKVLRQDRDEVRERSRAILEKVQLAHKADAFPGQLSGGQQQRVAIARALAMQPRIILFDEVTAALDPEMVSEVLAVIKQLAKDGMTCILVTHEMRFAEEVAGHVFFTDKGVIVESGPPKTLFHAPRDPRLKSFLEKVL
ncbi:MAG: amino acid ABC transporter ATP-binding protein [Aquamicrobium sp.]|uniref:amino acid ABC transporter ATP-binding protein n=1 Tax=Aquamicrobium sp. TaxID=1872579 RepID=UPI00349EAD03|nr:amino acid ABC transporter ATP-binding protein [Aquamicrobium sp.]